MIRFPVHLERQYAARLVRRLAIARRLVLERVRTVRRDAEGDDGFRWLANRFRAAIDAVKRVFHVVVPAEPESLTTTAQAVDTWATRATTREVERIVQVDLEGATRQAATAAKQRALHVAWARQNVALITTMEAETFDDLAEHVAAAVVEGRTDLADVIRDRFGVAESRARLIARDQIAKLNGRITQERQQALGIRRYEWSSSGDQRVRPAHRKLDGTIRSWDDPHPTEGHPGWAIACRCVAIPVVDDEDLEVPAPPAAPAPPAPPARPILPSTFGSALRPPVFAPEPKLASTFGGSPRLTLESPRRKSPPGSSAPPVPLPPHATPPPPPPGRLPPEVEIEVRVVEDRMRHEPEEHGAIVLRGGHRIDLTPEHTRDNGRDPREVLVLPPAALTAARSDRGAVLTHGHPTGAIFSPRDIQMAAYLDLAEIRATLPTGGAWVLRRPPTGWPDSRTVFDTIVEARRQAVKRAMVQMDERIIAAGGDPRDEQQAQGWDADEWERIRSWHVESGIREGIEQAGLVLEFEP